MAIAVGTNSWITEADADTYFGDRYGAGDFWVDDAPSNDAALITAYNLLNNCGKFSFPTTIVQVMKDLQCEMALFLIQHQPDIDFRMGLQVQGVSKAGVVKETYITVNGIAIPPIVADFARPYLLEQPVYLLDIERDEEQLTDYDAVSNQDRND